MKFKTKIVLYLTAVLFAAALGGGLFYYWIVKPTEIVLDAGEKIANGIADAFNFTPQVSVRNTIIFEEQAAILEVAVLSQRIVHDYEYRDTWMGSTKELHLRGVYMAKYGFDLKNQNFIIHIAENDSSIDDTYKLIFRIPDPILLSFETEDYMVLLDKDGWWNYFNENEREKAVNIMRNEARSRALSLKFKNRVKTSLETQFKLLVDSLPLEIRIAHIEFMWQNIDTDFKLQNDSLMIDEIQ